MYKYNKWITEIAFLNSPQSTSSPQLDLIRFLLKTL